MRVLIGAACVAVIAFVGYYFWGEITPRTPAVASSVEIDQRRLSLGEDQVLDKIARVDLNPYSQARNPDVFDALNRETITGELQRLRTFAAKDAAQFQSCREVESVHFSTASTAMGLAVDVVCSGGLVVTYTRNGPSTELASRPAS
jgi:hypothetical protein